jgi:tRNA pseudouridine55 synthase
VIDLPAAGGVVPVDKPAGPTSHDVVAVARRALGTRRVGHTGTLDPFATGLLLICVGPATRLAEFLTGLPKAYRARMQLGVRTTTDDPEGDVVTTSESWRELDRAHAERALAPLRGRILQTPPPFSAKKIGGEAAHYRARRGEDVTLAPVEVEVFRLDLVLWDPPHLELDVLCSSGTYVRALARDLGEALGAGAHLTALRRTAIGAHEVGGALDLDQLADPAAVRRVWLTPAAALAHLPQVEVGAEQVARLAHGEAVALEGPSELAVGGPIALVSERELVAVASREGDRLRPRKVFVGAPA